MNRSQYVFLFLLGLGLASCAHHQKPLLPVHDEVLVYQLPFDVTYLRTVDALESVSGWSLDTTDKENGVITVRNTNYSSLDDKDRRVITFLIKRISREETSVEIAKDDQQVLGGGELIKAVSRQISRELQT